MHRSACWAGWNDCIAHGWAEVDGAGVPRAGVWSVYIVQCADGSLYTGIARDLGRRLAQHNGERPGGARFTSGRRPVRLIWSMAASDRSAASRREAGIKKLSRTQKLALARGGSQGWNHNDASGA